MKFLNYKSTMQKNKKITIFLVILILLFTMQLFKPNYIVSADDGSIEVSLSSSVNEIVSALDLSGLEDILSNITDNKLFDTTVREKVDSILKGEYFTNYGDIVSAIFSIIFSGVKSFLPIVFTVVAISVLSSLINSFRSSTSETADMVYFVCYAVVVILILVSFKSVLKDMRAVIATVSKLMQIVFPILISLLAAIGSLSSVSIYNPLVAVLTTLVDIVFDKFLYPIFILIFIFTVIANLTTTVKLDKLTNFFASAFKWIIGIVFTVFAGFLSLQGISAGKFDSISIRATKFAIKSYIPIIGSFMADGMDFIVLGSVLVKNTVGLVAVLLLFAIVIVPIINVVIYKLLLQLSAGVIELTGSTKMSAFLQKVSKVLILPIVIVLGVSLMFVITIAMIMCTANIF